MKKIMLILVVVIVCAAMAAPAFAVTTFGMGGAASTVFAGATFAPSTGVTVIAISTNTAYAVQAVHNSSLGQAAGKMYGATSSDSTIKYLLAPAAVAAPASAVALSSGTWAQ